MPGRNTNNDAYRYAYNGMEVDDEVKGSGNSYTTEFRQYDPRLGRWLSLDPMMSEFPWMSPYIAFNDNPVYYTDPYGLAAGGPGDPPTKDDKEKTTELDEVVVIAKRQLEPELKVTVIEKKPVSLGFWQKVGAWLTGIDKYLQSNGVEYTVFGVELLSSENKQIGNSTQLPKVKKKYWRFVWQVHDFDQIMDLVDALDKAGKLDEFSKQIRQYHKQMKKLREPKLSQKAYYKKYNLPGKGKAQK